MKPDEAIVITGSVDRVKHTITATTLKLAKNFKNEIEPIYNIENIGNQQFQKLALLAYENYGHLIMDDMPKVLVEKYQLLDYHQLIRKVHMPKDENDLTQIDRRIKYEELFKFQFKMQYIRLKNKSKKNTEKAYHLDQIKAFIKSLPFELTNSQKHATNEIIKDIKSPYVMNRLLQGDVGSGKTVVAAISIVAVLYAKMQVALMAPTEILAKQHAKTFAKYLAHTPFEVVLLTGKLTKEERLMNLEKIKHNPGILIIGTHALFSQDVRYNNLGYVITDEQHRFGVNQRRKLREKGYKPDVLYMTATPIPRTLAISLFGDMDITTIKEKPKTRKPVKTQLFSMQNMEMVHLLIEEELNKTHQIFIVTPLIIESEKTDLSNAQKVYKTMKDHYKDFSVGLLHSRIKTEDKEKIMDMFHDKKIDILVSTTVIEVGVDVPNATLMVVLNSERFGLSQLHQLRGRIGRGDLKGYCLLVYDEAVEGAKDRLEIMETTDNGFILSEKDLAQRGPGEFFGKRQSGDMKFKKADIIKDAKIMEIAKKDALSILLNKASYYDEAYQRLFKYLKTLLTKADLD